MSTRGFISFAVDGETKTAYNHSDSYPDGLGVGVLEWARGVDLKAAAIAARSLRVVDGDSEPTAEDVDRLAASYNPNVGGQSERPTWYQLLRETMGSPEWMLAAGVIEDASDFPADSLFAEWGYVVDFDARTFEVYVGFQRAPHSEGRFADSAGRDGYYPVRLIRTWPLAELPTAGEFIAAVEGAGADV